MALHDPGEEPRGDGHQTPHEYYTSITSAARAHILTLLTEGQSDTASALSAVSAIGIFNRKLSDRIGSLFNILSEETCSTCARIYSVQALLSFVADTLRQLDDMSKAGTIGPLDLPLLLDGARVEFDHMISRMREIAQEQSRKEPRDER